ncbi:MAG TPA: hypothetical protein VHE81_17460, partial [Lacipirellulaceae bacterium]|nr:hypothetical protein [Lacipirellulaceae bacterium]
MQSVTKTAGFLRKAATAVQPALLSALLVLAAVGVGGPRFALGEPRTSESHEHDFPVERSQEFTPSGRCDHARQMKVEQRRLAGIFNVPTATW